MGKQLGRHFCFYKMTYIKKVSLLLLTFLNFCVCEYSYPDELDDGEERSLFTSGGVYYLALNTTTLIYYALGAGAIILLLLLLTSMASPSQSSGFGQNYGYDQFQRRNGEEADHNKKREALNSGFLTQLLSLSDAFTKYSSEKEA